MHPQVEAVRSDRGTGVAEPVESLGMSVYHPAQLVVAQRGEPCPGGHGVYAYIV